MKKMGMLVVLATALIFTGCGGKSSDTKTGADAQNEFIKEFGGNNTSRKSTLIIFNNGNLEYVNRVNDNCTLKFHGKINSVTWTEDYYTVSYHFHTIDSHYTRCRASDSLCGMDVADCKRAINDYERRRGESHTSLFKKGSNPDNVVMLP